MKKQIIIASRYHVIRKIGEGGMAKVYLAYDNIQEINVALKVLKKENVQEKKIKHFKREANALSLMDDDNIVKIYDVGEEGDIHYIVNEYVDGMTLKEYISTCSPLPVEEVIEITKQILSGLEHAHKRGVVHKDIKSQNILLNEKKDAKITDFGIADIMDDDATKTQSVMGTPQYVAPEILNREELTEQSDLYSVGILMYEMLVGSAPFSGDKPAVIMIKQMNHPLPSVREERPDVPQSLENIIIKGAAKTLENRYKSAEDMLYDLETVLEEERLNEKKLFLVNDYIDEEKLEKDVLIDGENKYTTIKNNYDKEKKRKKLIIWISAITGVLILLAIILAIIFGGSKIVMPDLVDKNVDDSIAELELLGITEENVTVELVADDEVEENNVISSSPKAGTEINEDSKIILYVSKGTDKVIMPNYVGVIYQTAADELNAFEKDFKIEYEEQNDESEAGTILSQNPEQGTELEEGDTITFVVSKGPEEVKMPNFYGQNQSVVDNFELDNDVTVDRVNQCSDTYPDEAGIVIDQSPDFNTVISSSTDLSVTVSNGKPCTVEVTPEPNEDANTEETTEEDSSGSLTESDNRG